MALYERMRPSKIKQSDYELYMENDCGLLQNMETIYLFLKGTMLNSVKILMGRRRNGAPFFRENPKSHTPGISCRITRSFPPHQTSRIFTRLIFHLI